MPTDKQFYLDSAWRAFRTFCQTLAGMLVVVQTSNAIPSAANIDIPWQAYLYASAIAGLVSLLQSVDRERAVNSVTATAPVPEPALAPVLPLAANGPGCGGDQR